MRDLNKPLLIAALGLIAVTLSIEVGGFSLPRHADTEVGPVGQAIPSLLALDGLLLFSLALLSAPLLIPERIHGTVQGITSLVACLGTILVTSLHLFVTIGLLIEMMGLLLSIPIGTAIYSALYIPFPSGRAASTLGAIMLVKIAASVCLIGAHQRFLLHKSLVLLFLTSLVATLTISFAHGIARQVAGPLLVSIADCGAAIVVLIMALLWAIALLAASVSSITKLLTIAQS
jgi:hypothetical protein